MDFRKCRFPRSIRLARARIDSKTICSAVVFHFRRLFVKRLNTNFKVLTTSSVILFARPNVRFFQVKIKENQSIATSQKYANVRCSLINGLLQISILRVYQESSYKFCFNLILNYFKSLTIYFCTSIDSTIFHITNVNFLFVENYKILLCIRSTIGIKMAHIFFLIIDSFDKHFGNTFETVAK